MNRRIRRTTVAVVLMLTLLCCEALAGAIPCYINANTKIYNRPWSSANSLDVQSGTSCHMVACQGNWALVSRGGLQAFIPLHYLTLANRITAYAAKDTVLYAGASTSSAKSPTLPRGTTVYIVGRSGSFYRVQNESGSVTGYMEASCLTGTKPTTRVQGYISQDTLLYASPSTSARSCILSRRTPVYVIGKSGNFFCVQNYEGTVTGYVAAGHVTDKDPGSAAPTPSLPGIDSSLLSTTSSFSSGMSNAQKLEYVIYVAQNLYGRPYAADANPPETFDCSRYVKYCFAQANISLSSTARTQGYDDSYAVISSVGSLRRGDIVCLNTDPSDDDLSDHTGIYLGQGYFIHSSSGAGKVIVSSLVSGYYKDNFSWGRRILN